MPILERLPAWSTTGVGSLPHDDSHAAVAHVMAAYEVPFCPQLPRLEGDMITEWLGEDPGRCGWSRERDRERPRAWDALLAALDRNPPPHRVAKLQVTGPATLACALERERGALPSRSRAIDLAREIAAWLAANAGEQVRALAARGIDAVLVVDEPALHLFGTDGVDAAWDPLRAVAPAWGLHLCCPVPWETVNRAEPDLLSFDLALNPVGEEAAAALARHLDHGRRVAWGALRVERPENALHAIQRLDAALARLDADPSRSLITPTCGSGRMSKAREQEITTALADIATAMRTRTARTLAG